jgi:hypothetical protein
MVARLRGVKFESFTNFSGENVRVPPDDFPAVELFNDLARWLGSANRSRYLSGFLTGETPRRLKAAKV